MAVYAAGSEGGKKGGELSAAAAGRVLPNSREAEEGVLGGILIDNEQNTQERVPGLASLPLVGNLFRRNAVSHNTQEILFFVTPRIVK